MKTTELERYADLIVRSCLSFRRGDDLVVRALPAHRELWVALADSAYRAGARTVELAVDDPRLAAARIDHGSDDAIGAVTPWQLARARGLAQETTAVVQVTGEVEARVLAALPPERVAEDTKRRLARSPASRRARREGRRRGTICAWPTADWAARVFPGLDETKARRALGGDLLSFCRIGPGDPPGHRGWAEHLRQIRRRAARLTKLGLRSLEICGPSTELRLRLSSEGVWVGGDEENYWGLRVAPNVPTEECFTSPEATGTEGTFRCSRPRQFGGRTIEGLAGEFRRGRLVRLEAKRAADRDWLARYLASIPNADRLGEIALVDSTSRIGRTGRVYYNALLDENAAAHIAFGIGFPKTRLNPTGRGHQGVNQSKTHIDVMIGTDETEAAGVTATGRRVALIRDGLWQI